MGIMSDLVSGTLGNTSDVDGGEQNAQPFSLAPLTSGGSGAQSPVLPDGPPDPGNHADISPTDTSNMVNGILAKAVPGPQPINYNDVQDVGPGGGGSSGGGGGGGGGIMSMVMGAMSDVNSKKNISFAEDELDSILNKVYLKLKNG